MGLVTLCMFCSNCLLGASSWIRNRWVLWVPQLLMFCSNCVLQGRTVTHTKDMGPERVLREHHWFSVLSILAIKLIFTGGNRLVAIRKQMIMLVVGIKGQSAG